jgi:hypothetical protein
VEATDFIHVDFTEGKRVLAWIRGRAGIDRPIVVVASFSSWGSDVSSPAAEYVVPNWPRRGAADGPPPKGPAAPAAPWV